MSGSNFTEGVENTPQFCTGRKKPSASSSSRLLFVSATVELYYVLNLVSKSDWPTGVPLHPLACFDSARRQFTESSIP